MAGERVGRFRVAGDARRIVAQIGLDRLADRALLGTVAAPAIAAVLTLVFVVPTLLPGVSNWDTAEFQTVGPVMGTGHPTGYPSYVVLGWLASILLQPFGEPAFRMNLLQAVLAAAVVASTVAIVQYLTGLRWVALATGLLFLVMPTVSQTQANFPVSSVSTTPLLWQLATHADYHMFHLALVALMFLLLLVWERRRTREDVAKRGYADRWLVAAACVYGIAFTNHGLAWLLPPAIVVFVLAVAPRILLQWRLVLACLGVAAVTILVLFAEMPIRAAMNAPVVYDHPDTWSGFLYVALAQQFGGSLVDPWGDLGSKVASLMDLMSGWLGPLGYLAVIGIGTSVVRRPRFVLLSLGSAAVTAGFAASYMNAEIDRYFLVPLFVAFLFVGLGLADVISLGAWLGGSAVDWLGLHLSQPAEERSRGWSGYRPAILVAEVVAATVLIAACVTVVPVRQSPQGTGVGAMSLAGQTSDERWMRGVLASPQDGGVAANAVIVSWWSVSTTLWYGQHVLSLRPDVTIVDDSDRMDGLVVTEQVTDVYDQYLGKRPVYTIRIDAGGPDGDGIPGLCNRYDIQPCQPYTLDRVLSKK